MKKLCVLGVLALLLAGCSATQQYETMQGSCYTEEVPAPGVIGIVAPDDLSAPIMSMENSDRLYVSDDYVVTLQTLPGGDLNATLVRCTGFGQDRLTVLETEKDGMKRYDCAWTSAGEGAQTVSRATILEDGYYHYVLTVSASGSNAETMTEVWQQLADSFNISIVQ